MCRMFAGKPPQRARVRVRARARVCIEVPANIRHIRQAAVKVRGCNALGVPNVWEADIRQPFGNIRQSWGGTAVGTKERGRTKRRWGQRTGRGRAAGARAASAASYAFLGVASSAGGVVSTATTGGVRVGEPPGRGVRAPAVGPGSRTRGRRRRGWVPASRVTSPTRTRRPPCHRSVPRTRLAPSAPHRVRRARPHRPGHRCGRARRGGRGSVQSTRDRRVLACDTRRVRCRSDPVGGPEKGAFPPSKKTSDSSHAVGVVP
jgi:hypothetical protein